MQFEEGHIYHIYNQGNNRQKVFFDRENYLFFLRKVKTYILPYADILAWYLMPNHFHIMALVNHEKLPLDSEGFAQSEALANEAAGSEALAKGRKIRTFNSSIGIMLRSYTNAINKQQNRTGALFRKNSKAECITCSDGITPSFYNTSSGTQINITNPEKQYPELCFHYIHQNPVKAGLVQKQLTGSFLQHVTMPVLETGSW
jgi:putative transposase